MNIKTLIKEAKYFKNAVINGAMESNIMKYGAGPAAFIGGTAMVSAGDQLQRNLKTAMQTMYKFIVGISTALAVLLIAWNILKYMAATDPQTAMMAKKTCIRVAIAWVILNSMAGIANLLTSLRGDNADLTGL